MIDFISQSHSSTKLLASAVLLVGVFFLCGLAGCGEEKKEPAAKQAEAAQPDIAQDAPQPSAKPRPQDGPARPEQLVAKAWEALGAKDYTATVEATDECIAKFEARAMESEQSLVSNGAVTPGEKVTAEQRKEINAHGILNSVAICYYIKGLAFSAAGIKDEARAAWLGAIKFTHARIWNPKKGAFWSPAEELPAEIEKLK